MTTTQSQPKPDRDPAQASSPDALCAVRGVTHEFAMPNGARRPVLEGIDLEVRPREVVALLGPSGCGKSTILRILAGLLRPTQGEVLYHGKPLTGLTPGVAMVFQSFALFPWMTVTRNIEVVLEAAGLPPAEVAERVGAAIRLVGLAGSEEAYPRELSGGMKQRVGMARALSLKPEMLFMDEPFSQVDALTAEALRAEVLDIWTTKKTNPSSILMVSHDIKEVVFMADRIVVLGANPGVVRTVVENKLPRPRDYRSPESLRLVDQLHDIITGHYMPDVEAKAPGPTEFEPLPDVPPSEVVGLLEYLEAHAGGEDLFRIASDANHEFGRVIAVVKTAEMLDLVDTPKRLVVLTPEGKRLLASSPDEGKALWREQLLKLRLFKELFAALQAKPHLDRRAVLALINQWLPKESYEQIFDSLVSWARFGDLFAYDEATQTLSLQ